MNEVFNMYKKTEKLPGLDFYVNHNFEYLSDEDKAKYVLAADAYMKELEKLAESLSVTSNDIMCHEIVFDITKVFDPYDCRWLKEYPLYCTKYLYRPIPESWLGRRVRELNHWIQIYIPDPKGILSEDAAIEQAVEDAQEYIDKRMQIRNEWEQIREKFG